MKMGEYAGRDPVTLRCIQVSVEAGVIQSVRECTEDAGDVWLAPGLVDLQVNGFAGVDLNSERCTEADVVQLTRTLASLGTTTFLPTVITAPADAMAARLQTIARARDLSPQVKHAVPCIHLEGPYLSPLEGFRGAHPASDVRPPSLDEFDELQSAAHGLIRLVTLSPHWPGSSEFIRALRRRGVVVAIGHTHASPEQIRAAVDARAQVSTHVGNAVPASLPRHPNQLWTQLAEDRLAATFIADGAHLSEDVFKVMLRAKTVARSVLISDSVALAGSPAGEYDSPIGGRVAVHPDGTIRMPGTGLLAGSGIVLKDAVARATVLAGCTLGDALTMATANPAKLLSLARGRVLEGAQADLVLFRWSEGQESLDIVDVLIQGESMMKQQNQPVRLPEESA